jgi:hypothetical protein
MMLMYMGGQVKPIQPMDRVPKVSVVIPCYNYGRYLRLCVESVISNQPGIQVEVIIVDDKSTDDSLDVACSIQSHSAQIKVISHASNMGHIATYNDGLQAATGEFVLLLSADDLVTPGALTRAAALLTAESSVGLVYGPAIRFESRLPPIRAIGTGWIVWSGVDWLRACCLSGYNVAFSPEVMMRTSVLRTIGGYRPDLPHAGDFEMWLRTAAVSDIGFLPGVDQAYYRRHASNMHKSFCQSGTGQLVDLKQRWLAFEAVFAGVGSELDQGERLLDTARRTIATQALRCASSAYTRGLRNFPTEEFEEFAYEICPEIKRMKAGQALARRKRLGMIPLPVHPLWAPSAAIWRLRDQMRRWRRHKIGV